MSFNKYLSTEDKIDEDAPLLDTVSSQRSHEFQRGVETPDHLQSEFSRGAQTPPPPPAQPVGTIPTYENVPSHLPMPIPTRSPPVPPTSTTSASSPRPHYYANSGNPNNGLGDGYYHMVEPLRPAPSQRPQAQLPPQIRPNIITGQLPDDFLRLTEPIPPEELSSFYAASRMPQRSPQMNLNIVIQEAQLVKNYGMVKMDPFCRIEVGPFTRTTPICPSGGKNPIWNCRFTIPYIPGCHTLNLDIIDAGTFFNDVVIAHVKIDLEPVLVSPVEEWFPLTGKSGKDKEGTILLQLSLAPSAEYLVPAVPNLLQYAALPSAPMFVPEEAMRPSSARHQGQPTAPTHAPLSSNENVAKFAEMFPTLDRDIILTVLASSSSEDQALTSLLEMAAS